MKGWAVKNPILMSAFCSQISINRVHFHVFADNNVWTACFVVCWSICFFIVD